MEKTKGAQLTDYTSWKLDQLKLYEISAIIKKDWKATSKGGIYFGAEPYLKAMDTLDTIKDNYFLDDAKTIIIYLLSNMSTYRGPVAKEIKEYLKKLVK